MIPRKMAPSAFLFAIAAGAFIALLSRPDNKAAARDEQTTPAGSKGDDLPAPVLDVKHLMDVFNGPVYGDLKKSLKEKPDGEKAWKHVENDALKLTEIANLVAMRKVPQNLESHLREHSAELQRAGLDLAKAAKSKDYDQARKGWHHVVQVCNDCHKHMTPGKGPHLEE